MSFSALEFLNRLFVVDTSSLSVADEQQQFLNQWNSEVASMRSGEDPFWRKWSPLGRAAWAAQMLDLLREECGFSLVDPENVVWLKEQIRLGESTDQDSSLRRTLDLRNGNMVSKGTNI